MNNDQPENQPAQYAPIPAQANPTIPEPAATSQPVSMPPSDLTAQISTLPQEANDIDLIEKEWVTHLKMIVAQTADNPYLQQQEISKAKADYMKKRYNKDIKIAEG